MAVDEGHRKLTAILAADVAGYSRLMADDDRETVRTLTEYREVFSQHIESRQGRIVDTAGDSVLATFESVIEAVEAAVEVQRVLAERNKDVSSHRQMHFRIGVNSGDIIVREDGSVYGDGVNVAARLEGLAEPSGIAVSEDAYRQVRDRLDIAWQDCGEHEVKNIARPVQIWRWSKDDAASTKVSAAARQLPLPDKPSIAVLPFDNISGDPEQESFSDGLVEDIITTLSKLAGLRVIARNSSFVYKGQAVDVRDVATQLGVRYVLEGSVRKGGNRIRITTQLIDADSGSHVWAERYDRAMDDIFAVQDEITLVLATEMQVHLTEGEQARLHYTTTGNVEAWTHWVKGLSHFRQAVTKENLAAALSCWQKALALDPDSAALHGMIGFMHYRDCRFGWWDDRRTALGKARTHAVRALELDPDSPDGHTALSLTLLLEGQYDEAAIHARRAVQLAPSSAEAATNACLVLAFAGYPQEAVAHGEMAKTLSPNYPSYYLGNLGCAYRLAGRIDETIDAFKAYHALNPGFGLSDLVIAYQQTDRPAEAKRTAKQLLSIRRDFTIAAWAKTQFRADKAGIKADITALRAAGLPMS